MVLPCGYLEPTWLVYVDGSGGFSSNATPRFDHDGRDMEGSGRLISAATAPVATTCFVLGPILVLEGWLPPKQRQSASHNPPPTTAPKPSKQARADHAAARRA